MEQVALIFLLAVTGVLLGVLLWLQHLERKAHRAEVNITMMHAGEVRALRFLDQAIRNGHDPSLTITAMLMRSEKHLTQEMVDAFASEWDHWTTE